MSQSIHQTDHLVNVSSQWKVIHGFVSYHSFFVDQESSSVSHRKSLVRQFAFLIVVPVTGQYAEVMGYYLRRVSNDRVSHPSDAALLLWSRQPSQVRLFCVARSTNHGYASFLKFFQFLLESKDLCRTHKSEILGIEKENNILIANVLLQREVFNDFFSVHYSWSIEQRGFFSY